MGENADVDKRLRRQGNMRLSAFCMAVWFALSLPPRTLAISDIEFLLDVVQPAIEGKFEAVRSRIDADPSLAARMTTNGFTLLHWIARNGDGQAQPALARYLVKKGANPNFRDRHGQTPLHRAAAAGSAAMVRVFLEVPGVDRSVRDDKGLTAADVATNHGHHDVVAAIRKGAPSRSTTSTRGHQVVRPVDATKHHRPPHLASTPRDVNLALHKPATQSSTYVGTGVDQSAACGVDGINDPDVDPAGTFITNADPLPWWRVDLGAVHTISHIRLYNRVSPGSTDRSRTIEVYLSVDGDRWLNVYTHHKGPWEDLDIDTSKGAARFVMLQLHEQAHFHLREVEVYGNPTPHR